VKPQVPPLRFAPVGMTNLRAVARLGLGGGGWTESPLQQPTRSRLPAFSLMRSTICAVQETVAPPIWTALDWTKLFGPQSLRRIDGRGAARRNEAGEDGRRCQYAYDRERCAGISWTDAKEHAAEKARGNK
jgi:hypothetical protein